MHYDDVISLLKPDYVIHGDNWKVGPESVLREHLIKLLDKYGGKLIEVEYTKNENVKKIDAILKEKLAMPEYRRKRLKQLINICPIVKVIEAHSGPTGLIAEKLLLILVMVNLINLMQCGFRLYVTLQQRKPILNLSI